MALSATFLGGAKGRLLAPHIPFRFFATAVLCHGLAWLALLWSAPAVPEFAGGLGWPLAALHLVTLGVLVMSAMGAGLQLLPVASRQTVAAAAWPYDLMWGAGSLGVLVLVSGMALAMPRTLLAGALLLSVALLTYLFLLLRNLRGAKGMRLVIVHGWVASGSLLLLVFSGLALALAYSGVSLLDRQTGLGLHVTFAGYGFMGMLVMGFSCVLVPMFALSENPEPRWANLAFALAIAGLLLVFGVLLELLPRPVMRVAIGAGLLSLLIHVALMLKALRTGMRQGLGKSFVLVRLGWACLGLSLLAALAREATLAQAVSAALFGVLLVLGLLTLLLGMLARIVPFLASMHAGAGMRRAPTPASLTAQRPLDIHFYCHVTALLLLLAAVSANSVWLVRVSAVIGFLGALAFGVFFVTAWQRMTANARTGVPAVVGTTQSLRQSN